MHARQGKISRPYRAEQGEAEAVQGAAELLGVGGGRGQRGRGRLSHVVGGDGEVLDPHHVCLVCVFFFVWKGGMRRIEG